MLDLLLKGAIALAGYTLADQVIEKTTGKHIHRHAVDFVTKLWRRLKNWAAQYLSGHPRVRKVYLSAVSIAAEIKKAKNKGLTFVRVKVFGKENSVPTAKIVKEEEVSLDEIDAVLQQAKANPILAVQT